MCIWKKTKEFGHISVSDEGNVRNDRNGFIYKPTINVQGYCVITGPDRKQYKIHRLVARAFPEICGEYQEDLQVDHINGIKSDNRPYNLRWCSIKENSNNPITRHRKSLSKMGDKNPMKNPEVARKSGLSKIGMVMSEEAKQKISIANKGKVVSESTKMKLSASARLRRRNNKGQFEYA